MSSVEVKCVQFEINNYDDRQNFIRALANAGYKVWATESNTLLGWHYYVNVEEKKP